MSNTKKWLDIISRNEIHAYNKVNSRDLSVCFNFLQIPDTNTVAMTVTIMKNKVKKNSLEPSNFAKLMTQIENSLNITSEEWEQSHLSCQTSEEEYFVNTKSELSAQWYISLCCHRIFFIPETGVFFALKNLFNQSNIRAYKNMGIDEVAVFVNTDAHDFNAKFY